MQDNLKDYIEQRREDFEVPFDANAGWSEISPAFEKTEQTKAGYGKWLAVAASLALLIVASLFVLNRSGKEPGRPLSEAEYYYQQIIQDKIVQVKTKVDDPELLNDLEALDKAFFELKGDLKDDVHNEEVVVAMMENYQLKLKILERILKEIEENEDAETPIEL